MNSLNAGITLLLATNVAAFKKDMATAGQSVEGFGASAVNSVRRVHAASSAIAAGSLAIAAGMVAMGAVVATQASKLETSLNNVATVWDEAGQKAEGTFLGIAAAGEQLIDMSTQLPQSAVQLADALYDVASSGFQGTEAMTVMEASAKAASAGLTTTEVAARGITTVLNAYNLEASDASHVSDVLFQTVNLGVVTFEELAAVMGDFVGMTATAGVSIEEASAALATMTLGGISAAEASTSLNRVMQEFIQPGETLSALLTSIGYESGITALKQDGLHGVLTKMAKVIGFDNVEAWSALFPEIRAVRGVLALMAGEAGNYTEIVGSLTDETNLYNQTQKALDKQSQSTSYQMTLLKNTVVAVAIDLGQALLPAIKLVVGVLQDFVAGINAIPDWIKIVMASMAGLIGLLVVAGGLWLSNAITSKLFALAMIPVKAALTAAGISTTFLTTALHALKVAMGVIGAVLTIAAVAMTVYGHLQKSTKVDVDSLKDSLDKQTGAITDGTAAWARDEAVKKGYLGQARELGISSDDLTGALLGNADAIARVNGALGSGEAALKGTYDDLVALNGANNSSTQEIDEAYVAWKRYSGQADKLRGGVGKTTKAIADQQGVVREDARAAGADAEAIKGIGDANAEAEGAILDRAAAHIASMEAINKEINAAFSLTAAWDAAAKGGDSGGGGDDAADRARRDRHKRQTDALDDELEAESDAADDRFDVRQTALQNLHELEQANYAAANTAHERAVADRRRVEDADAEVSARLRTRTLDDQHQAEVDAFDLGARTRGRQLDELQKIEEAGLDALLRTQQNAYDDQARIRNDAHDDAMEELRDQNDDRLDAEAEAWLVRKDEIQALIDSTFGAEREGWKATLRTEEGAYKDRLDTIEEEGAKLVRAETNAFDDRERALEQTYDDEERIQKDALATRHANEKQALADLETLNKDSLATRHANEKQALSDDLAAIKTGVEDRRRIEDQGWTDRLALDATKMAKRHADAETNLTNEVDLERRLMEKRQEKRQEGLDAIQLAEDDAADKRVSGSAAKHVPTMAELQAQVDAELAQRKQMNADLVIIATQGGTDVNAAVLAEMAKLGPEAVSVIASSGPAAIAELVTGVNRGITEIETTGELTNRLGNMVDGTKAGGMIASDIMRGLEEFLAKPPGAGGGFGLLGIPLRIGDGPGSSGAVGGAALSRVEGVLGRFPGAHVTSTYRTPEHNRAIGGSATSYHLDKTNPAVDIGGPTNVLNALHRQLVSMGGWRELLWQVEDHYDHIHAAADGLVSRHAMISSRPILWAEAGPEAYIPLSRSKRDRSLPLLAQAASAFSYGIHPMANGGIIGGGSGSAGDAVISIPIHVEARVDAGIDMGVAGRVIGDQVERGVRAAFGELERRVVVKAWRN